MIILEGNPISINALYRGRRFLTKQGKMVKDTYAWEVKTQWKHKPIKNRVEVQIRAFFGTKKSRDLDNICKAVLDSLTGTVIEDDSQIDALLVYRDYDPKKPRLEIDVIDYEN